MSEIDNQVPTEEDSGAPGTLAASPEPSVQTDARETAVQEGPAMQQVEAHAAESPASQRASGTVVTARRATEAPPSDNRPEQTPSQDTSDAAVSELTAEAIETTSTGRNAESAAPEPEVSRVVETPSPDVQASAPSAPEQAIQEVADSPPKARCVRVGPFKPDDADQLLSRLPPDLELVSDTSEETAEVDGYYVLIPPLASRAAGIQKVEELREAGINDIYLFRGGELRNAVSLGLYSNRSGAQTHADRLSDKGIGSVEVRERKTARERRWLQFRKSEGGDPEGIFPLPAGVRVIPQPCP